MQDPLARSHCDFSVIDFSAEICPDPLHNGHFGHRLWSIPFRWHQYTTIEHYGTLGDAIMKNLALPNKLVLAKKAFLNNHQAVHLWVLNRSSMLRHQIVPFDHNYKMRTCQAHRATISHSANTISHGRCISQNQENGYIALKKHEGHLPAINAQSMLNCG